MRKIIVKRAQMDTFGMKSNALLFLPQDISKKSFAIFSHGYTADKNSILTWATRFSNEGIPVALLDLPGHYLGSYNDVTSFELFSEKAHYIYQSAFNLLKDEINFEGNETAILGGHSLGALLALKAFSLNEFSYFPGLGLCVGFANPPKDKDHIFSTELFKDAMEIRSQLVSPSLCPENIFQWIREEKLGLKVSGKNIYLITGQDDFIAPPQSAEELKAYLETQNNTVSLDTPKSLPHNFPDRAAPHLYNYVKKSLNL